MGPDTGPEMGPQTLEGSVVRLQHGLLRTSTATPSPASGDSKAASATCSHSTQTLGLRGSHVSPQFCLLAIQSIRCLQYRFKSNRTAHGRKINTVSPEKNLDEREREKDIGRRQQQTDHSEFDRSNLVGR